MFANKGIVMFTPPNTIINRCKEKLIPSVKKGGTGGEITLLFSSVVVNGVYQFQLDIINTPKNYQLGRMTPLTSVVYRSANIPDFSQSLEILLNTIVATDKLYVGNVEFNYYKANIKPISDLQINQFIALDKRLCKYLVQNNRCPVVA